MSDSDSGMNGKPIYRDRWDLAIEHRVTRSEMKLTQHDKMHAEVCVWQRTVGAALLAIVLAIANGSADGIAERVADILRHLISK